VWRAHPTFHGYVFFQRWHGARPSEAAALTWDHVDLRQGLVYVRQSFHQGAVCEPKTKQAKRTIELHPTMVEFASEPAPAPARAGAGRLPQSRRRPHHAEDVLVALETGA
jgi:integrase